MLLGTAFPTSDLALYPLALGGISILASVIGTFFARIGRGGSIMNALYKSVLVATVLSAIGFIPVTMAFDDGRFSFWELYGSALIGLVVTFLLVAITEYYTGSRWNPVKAIAEGLADRPRDEHHRGPRDRHAGDGAAGDRDRGRDPRRPPLRRPLRDRRRRHGAALDDRPDRRARRVRPRHRQRRRDRRDGGPARVGARDHRPARRGRQHDEGGHEGLRDRLGRPRGARPLRQYTTGLADQGHATRVQPLATPG